MNAARLLALYGRIAEAPDAVARLRRFVLDLAVRGKLTGDAATWPQLTIGQLGRWGSGGTPARTNPDYYGGAIPWLVIGDLNDGIVTAAETHISEAGLANSSAKVVEPGTVLIAMYGSIGKLGIAGVRCATNQAIAHCFPDRKLVTTEYLFLLLKSLRSDLVARGQGVAQQNISQKILKEHHVRLPPLAEQHRIVAKVDELMALCDQLEAARTAREATRDRLAAASLARLNTPDPETFPADARFALDALPALTTRPDQIKHLRQTILNLAVSGKLVPQDPGDEPASELLERIAKERTRRASGRSGRDLPALGQDEIPHAVPRGWSWARLGSLGITQTGTTPPKSRPDCYGQDIPFLKPGDLYETRVEYGGEALSKLGAQEFGRIASPGSLLMVCIGTIGKCQVIDRVCSFNQQINALSALCEIEPRYLLTACRADTFQSAAWTASARTTIAILNKGNWEQLPVPLPPLAEQHRIVAKVDELMALCDALEASLADATTARTRLLDATLAEALSPAEARPRTAAA